jgi:hypothetical protein
MEVIIAIRQWLLNAFHSLIITNVPVDSFDLNTLKHIYADNQCSFICVRLMATSKNYLFVIPAKAGIQ